MDYLRLGRGGSAGRLSWPPSQSTHWLSPIASIILFEMTLILSLIGDDTGLFSVSDVLLSRPDSEPPCLSLPLQPGSSSYVGHPDSLAGLAQKMTLVSPTVMTLWSGSYPVARLLIQLIRDATKTSGSILDIRAIAEGSGLAEQELNSTALIVHQVHNGRLFVDSFNAQTGTVANISAAWDGSGTFDFLEDTIIRAAEPHSWQVILRSLMTRIISSLVGEAVYKSNYDYLYGGWFELIVGRTLGLRKIPYAIKFWGRRGNQLGYDAPLFFNWYKGSSLFVCSLDQHSGQSLPRIIEIPDLLSGKPWRQVRTKPIFRPEFTFHVVMDDADRHWEIYVSDRHSDGHMNLWVNKRGAYTMKLRRSFLDLMMSRSAVPAFVSSKASDSGA